YPYSSGSYAGAPYYGADYAYEAPPVVSDEAEPATEAVEPNDADDDRAEAPQAGDEGVQLSVRPADATIYVDGQFRGTAGNTSFVALAPGRHTIEVARPGFRSERRTVDVREGDTTT